MDTTQNNPSENKLPEEEFTQYKQIVESTPVCIKVFNSVGKLLFINKGGRDEHFIKDTDDITKWDWVGTVKPEYRPEVTEAFKKGLAGESSRVTLEHTEEGSNHTWCEGLISPIKNAKGEVTLLLFYSIDVTDRERAEAELLKTEHGLRVRNEALAELNKTLIGKDSEMAEMKRGHEEEEHTQQ